MGPSSDVHIPFTTFQQIYNTGDRVGWMVITGKSDYNIRQIEEDVKLLLRNLNKIHPRDNRALVCWNSNFNCRGFCNWKYTIDNSKRKN